MTHKQCTQCGELQPVANFCKSSFLKSGLNPACRTCKEKYRKSYVARYRDKVLRSNKRTYEKYKARNLGRAKEAQKSFNGTHKYCPCCKTTKPTSGFHKNSHSPDGLQSLCVPCKAGVHRRSYLNTREKVLKRCKEYYLSHQEIYQKTWQQQYQKGRHTLAYRARYIAAGAKNKGTLKQHPCEICREPKTTMHHEDYRKPLDVKWLCERHHKERDWFLRVNNIDKHNFDRDSVCL